MKKILLSLLVVGAVSASVFYGTKAYFSDTEQVLGNTFTTGTIDIAVDGENPWERTEPYVLADMKPSRTDYINFEIQNVGTNPTVVWKRIDVTDETTGTLTEPECTDQGGTWTGTCSWNGGTDNNDLSAYIHYDMTVGGVEMLPEDWGYMIDDVDGVWIPLGVIEPGESLSVSQSYHLDGEVGNWAQGDQMTFDITLYAEQRDAPGPKYNGDSHALVLENKTTATDWYPIMDGTWGYLSWDAAGNYVLNAYGLNTGFTYRLAYYDGTSETGIGGYLAPNPDGTLTLSGTYAGLNTNVDAKYWLRPDDWDNAKSLFESNLVNN